MERGGALESCNEVNLTSLHDSSAFFTMLPVAVSFAWLGVQDPSQCPAGVALYIIDSMCCLCFPTISRISVSVISYQVNFVYISLSIYPLIP